MYTLLAGWLVRRPRAASRSHAMAMAPSTARLIDRLAGQDPYLEWPSWAAKEWSADDAQCFYDTAGGWMPTRGAATAQLEPEPEPEPELGTEPEPELGPPVRVFACSDLHVDYKENWAWCVALSESAYQHDALIVAGDVTDDLAKLRQTLGLLKQKFGEVFFVPGNHDLWLRTGRFRVAPLDPIRVEGGDGGAAPPPPAPMDTVGKVLLLVLG
jgi:hypothetical protein